MTAAQSSLRVSAWTKTGKSASRTQRSQNAPPEDRGDGWRVLAYKDAGGVRLVSRNARDLARRFPELVAAVAALKPPRLLLDGEVAVFDDQLLSRFEWIRGRPKGCRRDASHVDRLRLPLRAREGSPGTAPAGRRNVLEELVDG